MITDAITNNPFIRMEEISAKQSNRCRSGIWQKPPGGDAQLWIQLLFWPIQCLRIPPGKYFCSYHKRHFAFFLAEINADAIQSANKYQPQIRSDHGNHPVLFHSAFVARKPRPNPVRHVYCSTDEQHGGHVLYPGANFCMPKAVWRSRLPDPGR